MTIEVRAYDAHWPEVFKEEKHRLEVKGQDVFSSVDHIGSTAVPGVWAKPYIDMVISVPDLQSIAKAQKILESCGYHAKGMYNIPFRWFFKRERDTDTGFHIHLLEQGNPEKDHWILLRDFLRTHPLQAQRYTDFKKSLVREGKGEKHSSLHILSDYTRAKNDFIQELLVQAKAKKVCVRLCCHEHEWEMAQKLAGAWIRDKAPSGAHMIVYEGAEIAGYLFAVKKECQYEVQGVFMLDWPDEKVELYFMSFAQRYFVLQKANCHKREDQVPQVPHDINHFVWWV